MKQKKKQNLSNNEKEKIYDRLVELAKKFDKKEEHKRTDHDDEDYFGRKELENLFGDIDNDNYYKPVLVRSSFKKIINIMKAEQTKDMKNSQ